MAEVGRRRERRSPRARSGRPARSSMTGASRSQSASKAWSRRPIGREPMIQDQPHLVRDDVVRHAPVHPNGLQRLAVLAAVERSDGAPRTPSTRLEEPGRAGGWRSRPSRAWPCAPARRRGAPRHAARPGSRPRRRPRWARRAPRRRRRADRGRPPRSRAGRSSAARPPRRRTRRRSRRPRARRRLRASSSITATPPFMSAAPSPEQRSPSMTARSLPFGGTVSRWPATRSTERAAERGSRDDVVADPADLEVIWRRERVRHEGRRPCPRRG